MLIFGRDNTLEDVIDMAKGNLNIAVHDPESCKSLKQKM